MKINLHVYLRASIEARCGVPFEPQIWHRTQFLQKNFIRGFTEAYLVPDLYVEVTDFKDSIESFSFEYNSENIEVSTSLFGASVFS